jgi:hypothetical protein
VISETNLQIHTRVGNAYQNWMHTAQTLFAASKVLKREHKRAYAALRGSGKAAIEMLTVWTQPMLTAFGIECLIKAIWLKQGNQLASNGKYVPMIPNERHRLVPLCRAAGIALDSREADALERMSDIARSIGRYPIGRRARENKSVSWSSRDDDIIKNLIVKLKAQLRQCPKAD